MAPIEESLYALATGMRGADLNDLAHRRAALEADLETLVRCALRNGTGSPGLVRWVRGALPKVAGTSLGGQGQERAAPILARLLCRTLVNQYRRPQSEGTPASWETVRG